MTTPRYLVNRRRFLKSVGMTIPAVALPVFRSSPLLAAPTFPRFSVLWYACGTIGDMFFPAGLDANWTIPTGGILEPLAAFKAKMNVLNGVSANSMDAGPGSAHQKGGFGALSAGHALPGNMNGGNNSPCGYGDRISVDQYLANKWGVMTPLKTLNAGVHMEGTNNRHAISYLGSNQPVFPVDQPAKLYAQAFGNFVKPAASGAATPAAPDQTVLNLLAERKSVLDYVSGDLTRLQSRLPGEERTRLGRHLESLRDLERRIAPTVGGAVGAACSPVTAAGGTDYPAITKMQLDTMFMAFACDQTRISHLMWNGETSMQTFPWLGINDPHHTLSHVPDGDKGARDKLIKIDRWYAEQVAYFVGKMDSVVEGNGKTMLDNSLVLFANGLGKGNNHTRANIPYALFGSAGGAVVTGKSFKYKNNHNDLFVSILNAMGLKDETTFGDAKYCTGPLPGLAA